MSSYRVILKTSHVGKLMERMVARKLMVEFESRGTLSDEMSTYRPLRSAQDSLFYLCSAVENARKSNNHLVALFYDISGAYNNLSHVAIAEVLREA